MASAKIVIITQEHRGNGGSTATYFLAQALAQRHIPVLLADMTGRGGRLPLLNKHFPTRNLVLWTPPTAGMRDIPALLTKARAEVGGKASCLLLDADLATLDALLAADEDLGLVDYLLLATDHTDEGAKIADRLGNRYLALRERNKFGIVFARIAQDDTKDLPEQTDDRLPILGFWPADYRLATSDDLTTTATIVPEPHQPYLDAIAGIATRLSRLTPLLRITTGA
jgi:hypothetical protein